MVCASTVRLRALGRSARCAGRAVHPRTLSSLRPRRWPTRRLSRSNVLHIQAFLSLHTWHMTPIAISPPLETKTKTNYKADYDYSAGIRNPICALAASQPKARACRGFWR
jgi:hypothetical protein